MLKNNNTVNGFIKSFVLTYKIRGIILNVWGVNILGSESGGTGRRTGLRIQWPDFGRGSSSLPSRMFFKTFQRWSLKGLFLYFFYLGGVSAWNIMLKNYLL